MHWVAVGVKLCSTHNCRKYTLIYLWKYKTQAKLKYSGWFTNENSKGTLFQLFCHMKLKWLSQFCISNISCQPTIAWLIPAIASSESSGYVKIKIFTNELLSRIDLYMWTSSTNHNCMYVIIPYSLKFFFAHTSMAHNISQTTYFDKKTIN